MPYVKNSILERMICRLEKARKLTNHDEIKQHISVTLLYLREIQYDDKISKEYERYS